MLKAFCSVQYATTFGSLLGVNIMGSYNYGDSFEPGKTIGQATASIALDLNLYPKTNIPLGLSTAYAYNSITDFTAAQYNTTWIGNAKIAYTGSDSFIISLDVSSFTAPYLLGRITETSDIKTRIFNAPFVLIYFNWSLICANLLSVRYE